MREFTLEDGFALSEILDKTGLDLDLNAFGDAVKNGNQAYVGGQLVLTVIKKMHLAKTEIIKLMASMSEEPIDEVKKWKIDKIKAFFTDLFSQGGVADFFQLSGAREDLDDLLLHRYGNIEYVYKLPIRRAVKLIIKAKTEERKAVLFQMWLMRFTLMDKESFVSFRRFYEKTQRFRRSTRVRKTRSCTNLWEGEDLLNFFA